MLKSVLMNIRHILSLILLILVVLIISTPSNAMTEVWRNSKNVAPGIEYIRINFSADTRTIPVYIVVNEASSLYHVEPRLAWDRVGRSESPVSYTQRANVPVAINAGYYDIGNTNLPIGHLRINSRTLANQKYNRALLGIDNKGNLLFARQATSFKLKLLSSSSEFIYIDEFNTNRTKTKNIFFTQDWGERTGSNSYGIELVLERLSPVANYGSEQLVIGDKYILSKVSGNDTLIPDNGGVLSIHSSNLKSYSWFNELPLGSIFQVESNLSKTWASLPYIVGGGPLLMLEGKSVLSYSAERFSSYYNKQHPRTIVATRRDGATMFIIVDGRNEMLQGITLTESVELCQYLNAIHAINFDGGGSSCLVIQNQIMNIPSDGKPRSVANFLVLTK